LRKSVKCILSSRLFSKFTVTPKKLAVEKPHRALSHFRK
jgi:hypothetical protein